MSGDLQARFAGQVGALSLDVAFTAAAGQVTALVGPSGSGKTTILRALAGLERLEGEVRLGDEVWQDGARFTPTHRRDVGYAFQHAALLPHLTVRANLAYAQRRAGTAAADMARLRVLLALEPFLDRLPDRLSGGERQRVAIARALAARPKLLLLDEPFSGLDLAATAELLPRLRDVLAALAVPALYVSHDPAEVREIATRVLRLEAGRLATAAEPSDALAGRSREEIAALARAAVRAGLEPQGPNP